MRELTPYGVDNFSVKDVCFEETTDDSFAQWLESRILHQIFGYNLEKKINVWQPWISSEKYRNHSSFFSPCDKIYTLWDELSLYINRKTSEMIGFHVLNIIFGKLTLTCHNKLINLLFLKRTNPLNTNNFHVWCWTSFQIWLDYVII